jgi:hypothetical protein
MFGPLMLILCAVAIIVAMAVLILSSLEDGPEAGEE